MHDAPSLIPIETVEQYADLLDQDFIKETLERTKLFAEVRTSSKKTIEDLKQSVKALENSSQGFGNKMEGSADTFGKLSTAANKNVEACQKAVAAFRELSITFASQAKMLRGTRAQS